MRQNPAPQPKAAANAAAAPAKSGRSILGLFIAMIMAVGAIALLPTTLILVVGMLPTAVAYFVDPSREKSLGPTVLFLNFAGVLPSLLKLWHQGHLVSNALDILMQPYMMLIILLPTGFAWILYSYVPLLVSSIVRRNTETRIKNFEKEQEYLVDEWGSVLVHPNGPPPLLSPPVEEDMESTLV